MFLFQPLMRRRILARLMSADAARDADAERKSHQTHFDEVSLSPSHFFAFCGARRVGDDARLRRSFRPSFQNTLLRAPAAGGLSRPDFISGS